MTSLEKLLKVQPPWPSNCSRCVWYLACSPHIIILIIIIGNNLKILLITLPMLVGGLLLAGWPQGLWLPERHCHIVSSNVCYNTIKFANFTAWFIWALHSLWRTSGLRLGVSAKAKAKFWRLIGFRKSLLLLTIWKRRSVAFQPCLTLGGVYWSKWAKTMIFSKKVV